MDAVNIILSECIPFNPGSVEILGSYALYHFLVQHDREPTWKPNDVDIYCHLSGEYEFKLFVRACCLRLNEYGVNASTSLDDISLVHDVILYEGFTISFIYVEVEITITDVCLGFDLTCCMFRAIFIDGPIIYSQPVYQEVGIATLYGQIVANNIIHEDDIYAFMIPKLVARQRKYEQRGFRVVDSRYYTTNCFKQRMMRSYYDMKSGKRYVYVVLFITKLLAAKRRASDKVYSPDGIGYHNAMVHFKSLISTTT